MATFYVARSEIITPLPWLTFALPFSQGVDVGAVRGQTKRLLHSIVEPLHVNLHSKLTQRDHLKMTHLRGSKAHRRAAPM